MAETYNINNPNLSGTIILKKSANVVHFRKFNSFLSSVNHRFANTVFTAFLLLLIASNSIAVASVNKTSTIDEGTFEVIAVETPNKIIIPKAEIDLSVKPAEISNDTWEVFEDTASFGRGTAPLNADIGNTVIFAHARSGLFSRLNELNVNDSVLVASALEVHNYKVISKIYVDPNDISFLESTEGKNLILFTCYGKDDEKRVVIIATFEGKEGNG